MRSTSFLSLPFAIVFSGCSDEPPDCAGAVATYAELCDADDVSQQLKYNGCTAYELGGTGELEANSRAWVDCIESASSCEDAESCSMSEE